MRQPAARKTRNQRLAAVFDQLCDADQKYIDTLTAQLVKIQTAAPETGLSNEKMPIRIVKQKKKKQEP